MNHLGLFAKFWEPGKVKTRLAADVGDVVACQVYLSFLKHLLKRFAEGGDARTIACSPSERQAEFKNLPHHEAWGLTPQVGDDLGRRMHNFFDWAFTSATPKPERVVLIGSDTPHLPRETISDAFTALQDCDVVLGPSTDGGYYLVGMSQQCHAIFDDVQWSTSQVFEQTISHLNRQQISYQLLSPLTDVDELKDLTALKRQLENEPEQSDLLAAILEAEDQAAKS